MPGDFDGDSDFDLDDVNTLMFATGTPEADPRFDLNEDGRVNRSDLVVWVKDIKQTTFGDANLSGSFSTGDLVQVFQANEYEDDIEHNSRWETGDWNGDGEFDSGDLIEAFGNGKFDPNAGNAQFVPESCSLVDVRLLAFVAVVYLRYNRRRNGR
ncbi:MAG: hypothetical protein KDB27_03245 [Planctomycetales bacterium]|nr:hypothetical protein [Planctomycetales bacterium]